MDTALYMVGYRYLPIYNIQCILALVITISIEAYLSLQCPPVCFRSPPPTSRFSVDMLATNGTRVKAVRSHRHVCQNSGTAQAPMRSTNQKGRHRTCLLLCKYDRVTAT